MPAHSFTVQDLPSFDRPRERLASQGAASLSTAELLAIILGKGSVGESVLVTAQKLLAHFGSLQKVLEADLAQLKKVKGIGIAKAAALKTCFELHRRLLAEEAEQGRGVAGSAVLNKPEQVYQILRAKLQDKQREHFLLVSLNSRYKIIGIDAVSTGSLTSNFTHPREIFKPAILKSAAFVIVAHNHPSGEITPSADDLRFTQRLAQAGKILGIPVTDHLIITATEFFSFKQQGLL